MTEPMNSGRAPRAWPWAVAFVVGMFGMAAVLSSGASPRDIGFPLMFLPMILLVPMVRAAERSQVAKGCVSAAVVRYNRYFMLAGFAYMVALGAAIHLHTHFTLGTDVTFLLALLPALAIFAMIWVMALFRPAFSSSLTSA